MRFSFGEVGFFLIELRAAGLGLREIEEGLGLGASEYKGPVAMVAESVEKSQRGIPRVLGGEGLDAGLDGLAKVGDDWVKAEILNG